MGGGAISNGGVNCPTSCSSNTPYCTTGCPSYHAPTKVVGPNGLSSNLADYSFNYNITDVILRPGRTYYSGCGYCTPANPYAFSYGGGWYFNNYKNFFTTCALRGDGTVWCDKNSLICDVCLQPLLFCIDHEVYIYICVCVCLFVCTCDYYIYSFRHSHIHACRCWGYGFYGQLGDAGYHYSSTGGAWDNFPLWASPHAFLDTRRCSLHILSFSLSLSLSRFFVRSFSFVSRVIWAQLCTTGAVSQQHYIVVRQGLPILGEHVFCLGRKSTGALGLGRSW